MIPMESDVFWTKPVGKKSSRTSKQCSVPCQKKVPSESDGIHWNPLDSHGNRWGRVKPSNLGLFQLLVASFQKSFKTIQRLVEIGCN